MAYREHYRACHSNGFRHFQCGWARETNGIRPTQKERPKHLTGPVDTTNGWTYATGYADTATGYLKLGARYYNPTTARFTQPDPSGQEPNTYNYAACNPVNNTDPTGLSWYDGTVR